MPANKNCQGLVFFRSKIILTNNFETIYHNAILIETCVLSRAVFPQQSKNLHQIIIRLQIEFLSLLFRWDFDCNWWFLSLFISQKNLNIPNNCNKTLQLHRLKDEAWVLWNLACINPPFVLLTASSYCFKNSQLIQMLLFLSLDISLD